MEIKSFVKIPDSLLGKVSLKALYLYAKVIMLQGKDYCQSVYCRTHGFDHQDLTRAQVAAGMKELEDLGFIRSIHFKPEGQQFYHTYYKPTTYEGYFKGVYYDFINRGDLPINVRGFAIALHLLKEIPTSWAEMSRATHTAIDSCKKYYKMLQEAGIITAIGLNRDYLPNLAEETAEKNYNKLRNDLLQVSSARITKEIKWLDSVTAPYKWKEEQLKMIEMGTFRKPSGNKLKALTKIILD
jgi:DNA-binding Lrp family transcriptional regulator